ncbi:unnamed protein product [Callosobruchus maculatus]|uniref:HSac2 domain-containing protein n=1 Tax=Callosobruchus maculatus TaxID=64391 RepID=A0A653DIX2_CALMS|nr:unnamed protein product [Callosobruchus maculatus]
MVAGEIQQVELYDFWTQLRIASRIASEVLPPDPPSLGPHLALQQEFEFAHMIYQMTRYYLSRFKDSTRQGTIDLMLGNRVSEDVFNESKTNQDEEDSVATAEHVKLLIEDCKKMLINQPEMTLGAWGLINADPVIGDPNETEMDTILILTKDSYFVADYDDQVDKVTNYQKVMLADITLLEFGMAESQSSIFKTSKHRYSIRINYKMNGCDGYYHMFRSTNLRFFNNMAVVIKSIDEEIESLKSICEAFIVAMDICGLSPVPFRQGQALDRRKSKVFNNASSSNNIYLDITSSLPQMTRNVSEGQLLSLKNVGSKAISNVTQQFSKLNKIGDRFKPKRMKQRADFIVGQKGRNETSSESDEDYENSIFQPNIDIESRRAMQYVTDASVVGIEQGVEVTEDLPSSGSNHDSFLPGVGIVMGNKNESNSVEGILENKQNLLSRVDSSQLNDVQLSSIMQNVSLSQIAPEIQISLDVLDTPRKVR